MLHFSETVVFCVELPRVGEVLEALSQPQPLTLAPFRLSCCKLMTSLTISVDSIFFNKLYSLKVLASDFVLLTAVGCIRLIAEIHQLKVSEFHQTQRYARFVDFQNIKARVAF